MQPQCVRDLAQHERAHCHFAVLEEMPLAIDDRLRYAQDRLEALLHILDEPLGFLQLAGELLQTRIAVAMQDVGVHAVHPQPRHGVGVERNAPQAFQLAHDHIGNDEARLILGEPRPRPWIEAGDQGLRAAQSIVVAAEQFFQLGEITPGQQIEMVAHRGQRIVTVRRVGGERFELERQALSQVSRADTRRLEML